MYWPPLLAVFVALGIAQTPALTELDTRLRDTQRYYLATEADFSDVLVIDVDESSMEALESQLGAWPYDREVYAIVNDYLAEQGARVIAFDILFSEARRSEGDAAFWRTLQRHRRTILAGATVPGGGSAPQAEVLKTSAWPIENFRGKPAPGALLPTLMFAAVAPIGIIGVDLDPDGVLRSVPLAVGIQNSVLPSMAMLAMAHPHGETTLEFDNEEMVARFGDYTWPIDRTQHVAIDLPRNARDLPLFPFYRVVLAALGAEGHEIDEDAFRGRTIFIGSTAAILGDYVQVPGHGRLPGLGMLALTFHSLKHGRVYSATPRALTLLVFTVAIFPLFFLPLFIRSHFSIGLVLVLSGFVLATGLQWWLAYALATQVSPLLPLLLSLSLMVALGSQRLAANVYMRRRLELTALAAKEAAELKGKFLAQMTHELRTPLTAILGYNKILLAPDLPAEDRQQHHQVINRSANHLLGLINNMLDQSKIEAGQLELNLEPIDVRALCEDAKALLLSIAEQKHLLLRTEVSPTVPARLSLDALRLRQILINLVGNGLKFTQHGGVHIRANWADGQLTIDVVDTGAGIPPETMKQLFVPFQQGGAHIAAEHGGTGLGLTISRNLAQLMGGSLTASSEPGQGATFTLAIPASVAQPPKTMTPTTAKLSGKVLLADDNPDNRNLLVLYLNSIGVETSTAENGFEVLEIVRQQAPDIVLMDVQMPEMDGLEATRELRALGFKAPILALTAHTEFDQHEAAKAAGCDDVLVKPIKPQDLHDALAQWINGGRGVVTHGR